MAEPTGLAQREWLFSSRQLRKNSLLALVRYGVSVTVFALSYRLYLRWLPLEIFGLWVIFTSIVAYLQLGALNLPQAVAKVVSEALALENRQAMQEYAAMALTALGSVSVTLLALTFLGQGLLARILFPSVEGQLHLSGFFLLTAVLGVQVILAETLGGILAGLGRLDLTFGLDMVRQVLTLFLAMAFLFQGLGLTALFLAHLLGYLIAIVGAWWLARRLLGMPWRRWLFFSWPHLTSMGRITLPLAGGTLMYVLMQPFNRLLLGYAVSLQAVGIYEIADRVSQTIRTSVEGALRPFLPQASGLAAAKEMADIRRHTLKLIRWVFWGATPLFLLLFFGGDLGLHIWLGKAAVPEMAANLRILMWGYFINMLSIPVYFAFLGMGRVGECFRIHVFQTAGNLILAAVGLYFVRSVWVVSLAVSVSLALASVQMVFRFLRDEDRESAGGER